jgi:hypothetical protein
MESYEQLTKHIDEAIAEQAFNSIALKKPAKSPAVKEKKVRLNIKRLM